jgi:hypothetical protein
MMLVAALAPALGADIYPCVDANGNLRFTNRTIAKDCTRLNLPSARTAAKVEPKDQYRPKLLMRLATHSLTQTNPCVNEHKNI